MDFLISDSAEIWKGDSYIINHIPISPVYSFVA